MSQYESTKNAVNRYRKKFHFVSVRLTDRNYYMIKKYAEVTGVSINHVMTEGALQLITGGRNVL